MQDKIKKVSKKILIMKFNEFFINPPFKAFILKFLRKRIFCQKKMTQFDREKNFMWNYDVISITTLYQIKIVFFTHLYQKINFIS